MPTNLVAYPYGPQTTGAIFQQDDPALKRRAALAQILMDQGSKYVPNSGGLGVLSSLAQTLAGVYGMNKVGEEETAKRQAASDTFAKAATGVPEFRNPDDTSQVLAPAKPATLQSFAQALLANPDTAPMGAQMLGRGLETADERAYRTGERKDTEAFQAGESDKNRTFQADRQDRQFDFTRGENAANRDLTRSEGAAGRATTLEAGRMNIDAADRRATQQQNFQSGENALNRTFQTDQQGRQFDFQRGENTANRTNALDKALKIEDAKAQRAAPKVESRFNPTTGKEEKVVWNPVARAYEPFGGTKTDILSPEAEAQKERIARAGKTDVSVNTAEQPFLKDLGGLAAKDVYASRDAAQGAVKQLDAIGTARGLLDKGVITGTGANFRTSLARGLGMDVGNTEAFVATMGQQTLALVKNLGAGNGISNADRDYAEKVAGGNIDLSEAGLRRILDINERAARAVAKQHNDKVAPLLEDPNVPRYIRSSLPVAIPEAAAPPAAPAPAAPAAAAAPKVKRWVIIDGKLVEAEGP